MTPTPAEGVPEGGPGAVCEFCEREECGRVRESLIGGDWMETDECLRACASRLRARLVEVEAIANEPCANCGFPTEDVIGKPKLAARLVEVERELTQARVVLGETELARRVAEGEARSLREALGRIEFVAQVQRNDLIRDQARLALSGLPPLASETVEPWHPADVKEPLTTYHCENSRCSHSVTTRCANVILGRCHCGSLLRAAHPTPAALVPKDAATPKAIAGEHKEEGRDG